MALETPTPEAGTGWRGQGRHRRPACPPPRSRPPGTFLWVHSKSKVWPLKLQPRNQELDDWVRGVVDVQHAHHPRRWLVARRPLRFLPGPFLSLESPMRGNRSTVWWRMRDVTTGETQVVYTVVPMGIREHQSALNALQCLCTTRNAL